MAGAFFPFVMDVWEHAFLLDYQPSERKQYIDSVFTNIGWGVVEDRLQADCHQIAYSRIEMKGLLCQLSPFESHFPQIQPGTEPPFP